MWKLKQEEIFHLLISEVFLKRMDQAGSVNWLPVCIKFTCVYSWDTPAPAKDTAAITAPSSERWVFPELLWWILLQCGCRRNVSHLRSTWAGSYEVQIVFSVWSKRQTSLIFQEITWAFLLGHMHLSNSQSFYIFCSVIPTKTGCCHGQMLRYWKSKRMLVNSAVCIF